MRAVRATPPGVTVVDVDDPDGDGVVVHVRSASICASDFGYIAGGATNVLGHEVAGVTDSGELVAVEAMFACGACELCERGQFNLCPVMATRVPGLTIDGGMAERFAVPAPSLVPLPDGLDAADACLVEPMSVAWHACRLLDVGPDTTVGVVGGGAIGLMVVAAARAMGAPEVGLEARYPHQKQAGERLGAGEASGDYDVVIEAAGSESGLHRAVELTRPSGAVGLIGVYAPDVSWPFLPAFLKEVRTVPSIGYCRSGHGHGHGRDCAEAAQLLASSPDLVDALITHRVPLDDAVEAFRVAADKTTGAFRVVLEPQPA